MAVPKKRTSQSRRDLRRSHDFFTPVFSVTCPNCGEPVLRHRICTACGVYRGKKLLTVVEAAAPEAAATTEGQSQA